MCYLCEEFGDPNIGGGIWYLNPKNYARNMYKVRLPGEGFKGADAGSETGDVFEEGLQITDAIINAIEEGDVAGFIELKKRQLARIGKVAGEEGQVVPLKEAERVIDICGPVGIMSCACRKLVRADDPRNEHEYSCMGNGVGMFKWERWPERYKGGVKFLSPEDAKEWVRKMDQKGFVHCLMLFERPYIGGMCQCDYPDCFLIRNVVDFGGGTGLLKSHFVASVDYDECSGCGVCAQRCEFGALKFEATTQKANIDQFKCFGCGLCETACPRKAIKLLDRTSLPALVEVW